MLRRVGERFRCDVVRRDLDRLRETHVGRDVESDGEGGTARQSTQGGNEAALGKDGWVNAPRYLLEFRHRIVQCSCGARQLLAEVVASVRNLSLGGTQGEPDRDEA